MATDYLGTRGERIEVERDQAATLDSKIAKLERAAASVLSEGAKAGLDAAAIRLASANLNEELAALRRHREQVEGWRAEAVAEGDRVRQLWELAEVAQQRLHSMTSAQQAEVYDLLQLRVHISGYCPLTLRIEGSVCSAASLSQVRGGKGATRAPKVVGRQGLEPCPPD